MTVRPPIRASIEGALLGTAVGDSLGLPREGLSRRRAARLFGDDLEHRMVWGRGMVSDDTEHACFTAQALLAARGDPEAFGRSLAWRLRGWLLGVPAGVGFGTLRAVLKLWIGFPPHRSGVFSAGNGPAMRAPILGVYLGDTPLLREVVRVSTRVTHTDPKAEEGALAVALCAHYGSVKGADVQPAPLLEKLCAELKGDELRSVLETAKDHLARGSTPAAYAEALGQTKGVSGYVNHTVPLAIYCWLNAPNDFRAALTDIVALGGDSDTTGAILGGIAGATVGSSGIPEEWVDGICEWPRSVAWIRRLAVRLEESSTSQEPLGPLSLFWPAIPIRNLLFLLIVLGHGFRRLLPPY